MAETLVENRVCSACGADVRPRAFFCYNCGSSVAPEIVSQNNNNEKKNTGRVRFRESLDQKIEKPKDTSKKTAQASTRTNHKPKPVMQSAANLKRKAKTFQRKKIEIAWEERENSSSIWFILAGILLTLFAVGIVILAIYLN